jgi:hypothetical protein
LIDPPGGKNRRPPASPEWAMNRAPITPRRPNPGIEEAELSDAEASHLPARHCLALDFIRAIRGPTEWFG